MFETDDGKVIPHSMGIHEISISLVVKDMAGYI